MYWIFRLLFVALFCWLKPSYQASKTIEWVTYQNDNSKMLYVEINTSDILQQNQLQLCFTNQIKILNNINKS